LAAEVIDLRPTTIAETAHLFAENHAYRGTGKIAVYALAVYEEERPVAAFLWQPPRLGRRSRYARSARRACSR
jgi:hypothetical protein